MKAIYSIVVLFVLSSCQFNGVDNAVPLEPEWVKIEGDDFVFGSAEGRENEKPEVKMRVGSFYLSSTEVTNRMFFDFVNATGYITDAEKSGEGTVFIDDWKIIMGADWKHPMGSDSSIDSLMNHPVVQVSYNDALAYCRWVGGRLPTEVELEFANKKGGLSTANKNIWTGKFPSKNSHSDGYLYTAPVDCYPSDELGLYHIQGNVWEWCADTYNYEVHDKWKRLDDSKQHVYLGKDFDLNKEIECDTLRVIKGGSFMCYPGHCAGYLPEARQSAPQNEAFFHVGFRIAKDFNE